MGQDFTGRGGKRPLRIGKYEVVANIATGGMGAVYKAIDNDLNRFVALKILSREMAAKPSMVERFKREAKSAAKLRHENIVAIYDWGELKEQNTYFLALEFIEGRDLHDHIVRRHKIGLKEARSIMIQATRALDHAHRNSIIHRDVKPSNFLITKTEAGKLLVKLTDLGLARQTNDEEDARVTKPETTIGTVDYMSPEQAQSSGTADIRSDIYSLGCTFYHMLGGKPPYPVGSLVERVMQHREADIPDVRALNPAVSPNLSRMLRKMMAKKPEDRYQTPHAVLVELEKAANFKPVMPEEEGPARPAPADKTDPAAVGKPKTPKPADTSGR